MIADDHPVVREGLTAIIQSQRDMELVGEAADGQAATTLFRRLRPDVALLDLRMPVLDGLEACRAILKRAPEAKIIMLSVYHSDEDVYQAIKAGAQGYLLKDAGREELMESIRRAHAGKLNVSPVMSGQLAAGAAQARLTKREAEIMELIAEGKSNKEIANLLGITESTAKVHTGNILRKLGASGRAEAIRIAIERGLVQLGTG